MKVRHRKGIANHSGPESCGSAREGATEALTGESAGQPLSREIRQSGAPTLLSEAEGHIGEGATREPSTSPTRSKTLSMRRSSPNRNCEISPAPAAQLAAGGSGKAIGRTPDIHAGEKSDARCQGFFNFPHPRQLKFPHPVGNRCRRVIAPDLPILWNHDLSGGRNLSSREPVAFLSLVGLRLMPLVACRGRDEIDRRPTTRRGYT